MWKIAENLRQTRKSNIHSRPPINRYWNRTEPYPAFSKSIKESTQHLRPYRARQIAIPASRSHSLSWTLVTENVKQFIKKLSSREMERGLFKTFFWLTARGCQFRRENMAALYRGYYLRMFNSVYFDKLRIGCFIIASHMALSLWVNDAFRDGRRRFAVVKAIYDRHC